MRPYQSNLLPGIWRWWFDFGTGDAGNDGVHEIDIARWGLGVNTHPSNISAMGGKSFFDDDQQFPDTMYCSFGYPGASKEGNAKQLIYEHRIWSPYIQEGYENGNAFYGTKGMIILGKSGGWQLFGPKNKLLESGKGSPDVSAHHQNFIDCIQSGKLPNGDIAEGHLSASLAHLAQIIQHVGLQLVDIDALDLAHTGQLGGVLRETAESNWVVASLEGSVLAYVGQVGRQSSADRVHRLFQVLC